MKTAFLALIALVVGFTLLPLSVLGRVRGSAVEAPPSLLPLGHEASRPGAEIDNGWAIANIGPCTFLDTYKKAWNILGEPVSGFDGVNQSFEYGQLVCMPENPAGQQVVLANLGYTELRSTGKLPQPNAPLDPAVQDFLALSLDRGGIEPAVYFGAPIAPPSCDTAGECEQYLEKTLLLYPQGATSGEEISRAPLGLWQSHPEDRPQYLRAKAQAAARSTVRWPLLISGLTSLVIGLGLLLPKLIGLGSLHRTAAL